MLYGLRQTSTVLIPGIVCIPFRGTKFLEMGCKSVQIACVPLSEIKKSYFAALVPDQNPTFSEFHLATIEAKERNRKSASLFHRSVFRASHQKWGRWDAYDTRVRYKTYKLNYVHTKFLGVILRRNR